VIHNGAFSSFFDSDQRVEIVRLFAEFVRLRPQIVHLWQDRTNLVGSVAAALAGVPKILLSARSTRPRTRQRYRNYMQRGYRALLTLPEIVLSNNSQAGARDYADWLGVPAESIEVIWNGFDFDTLLDPANVRLAAEMRAAAGIPSDAFVVGGVFRIAQVKRPILWAETAARVLQHFPMFISRSPAMVRYATLWRSASKSWESLIMCIFSAMSTSTPGTTQWTSCC
jgi:hypothetical protein